MTETVCNYHKDNDSKVSRRDFVTLTASSFAAIGAASFLWPFISSLNPSADVLALASVEVDISKVQEGQTIVVQWRGKPVFIRHRTKKEIEESQNTPLSLLKHQESDDMRVQKGKEQWLITIGICTHLGCVPLANQGEYGGWFCPCHGSHYDTSGRIRKGPAPENLHIPTYTFASDTKIIIG
jgi:ubiquinol-cytochrome c reductase iron-sulfur subunit